MTNLPCYREVNPLSSRGPKARGDPPFPPKRSRFHPPLNKSPYPRVYVVGEVEWPADGSLKALK